MRDRVLGVGALVVAAALAGGRAAAQEIPVLATDAISLAGRTDIAIPPLGGDLTGFPLPRPDLADGQTVETPPGFVEVLAGEELYFAGCGLARFAPAGAFTGPDGDAPKDVLPIGGISGYVGQGGSLVGVFLDDEIPVSDPPSALDFSDAGLGTDFAALAPALGQIFFIGDGRTGTDSGARQRFTAPAGATRLFFGTMDSTGLGGPPGYYTDNVGAFGVTLVPEPGGAGLGGAAALALAATALRRRAGRAGARAVPGAREGALAAALLVLGPVGPAPAARFEPVADGLNQPVFVAAPAGDDRIFIVELPGRIRVIADGALRAEPFLDLSSRTDTEREGGLTGLVFPPDFGTTGRFLVYYTEGIPDVDDREMEARVSSFAVEGPPATALTADPDSEQVLLALPMPSAIHHGSTIAIRGDWLYVAVGDGGGVVSEHGGYDPDDEAQRDGSPFGKILRLSLATPMPSNEDWEVWAKGFRNPSRFSFDRATGDLYLGDVGQDRMEEIDVQPADAAAGANFGWDVLEGTLPVDDPDGADPGEPAWDDPSLVPPVYEYPHDPVACGGAVTGGYVYRGTRVPELQGHYLFSDFCQNRIWSLVWTPGEDVVGRVDRTDELMPDPPLSRIAGFGEDGHGELYVTALGDFGSTSGRVYRLPESASGGWAAGMALAALATRRRRARA